ncbi:MAG TPA: C69 family dipeptidase, partial [Bacteroidales bacterium]|nr:C69 family dipeptidase [Bacteroidales bacterium]
YVKPDKKLSVHDVMELMRDIYQGTELDMTKDVGAGPFGCGVRWRPLEWEVDGVTYFNERATSTQQTGFSFVAQSREWLPSPIGGILWFGVDDTYFTIYSPMYCGITKVPESYAEGNGSMMEFSETSAFWAFNQLSNFAYTRWNLITPETRKAQYEIEMSYINEIKNIDNKALALYKKSPSKAIKYLTEYSVKTGNNTVNFVKNLYRQIFVKYMDGNVKEKVENQKNPKVIQPGYGENWYRLIIKETGDKF